MVGKYIFLFIFYEPTGALVHRSLRRTLMLLKMSCPKIVYSFCSLLNCK